LIPMTRAISTTQFKLRRSEAVGASVYTSPTSPLMWSPAARLDREARRRGNSVYLPDRVIPMLPERLSNGVCSLKPGVDRLTHSVFIHFDKRGSAKSARFTRSVIRSAHRLTYKQAYAILTAAPCDQLGERLHLAWELACTIAAEAIRARRPGPRFPGGKSLGR
jgi:exoribonuclease R